MQVSIPKTVLMAAQGGPCQAVRLFPHDTHSTKKNPSQVPGAPAQMGTLRLRAETSPVASPHTQSPS